MKITFLGTGTSSGVPMIGCPCVVCHSANEKDKRLRSSLLIETANTTVVIDCGPDFRQQMLTHDVKKIDAIIFTHAHKDHTAGLDDIRAFNFFMGKPIEIFATAETENSIRKEFAYAFSEKKYPGLPEMNFNLISNQEFSVNEISFLPIAVKHLHMPVLGFRFHDFTYVTDANFIAEIEKEKIRRSKYFVLNALRNEKHISHFNLEEAVALAQEINCDKTFFTHISHQLGLHDEVTNSLPDKIELAFDGLKIML